MNLKNASIFTTISVSSLGLLSSCGNKESEKKPATLSGSYKIVSFTCGTRESSFTPIGARPNTNSSFMPHGLNDFNNPLDIKIKFADDMIYLEYIEMINNTTKCKYFERLQSNGRPSSTDPNFIYLIAVYNNAPFSWHTNANECSEYSPISSYPLRIEGGYELAQNDSQVTLTSIDTDYCRTIDKYDRDLDKKLILTLEKEEEDSTGGSISSPK